MLFYQLCKQLDVFRPGSRGNRTRTAEDVPSPLASNVDPVHHRLLNIINTALKQRGDRVQVAFNKSFAFAYVQAELAKDETELLVEIQGQKRKAKILNTPAYDPQKKKLKS